MTQLTFVSSSNSGSWQRRGRNSDSFSLQTQALKAERRCLVAKAKTQNHPLQHPTRRQKTMLTSSSWAKSSETQLEPPFPQRTAVSDSSHDKNTRHTDPIVTIMKSHFVASQKQLLPFTKQDFGQTPAPTRPCRHCHRLVLWCPILSASASPSSPPSSGSDRTQWLVDLSMRTTRNHCSLACVSGKTARVMAARLRRRAIRNSCWRAFADICCPLRHDAMSAAYCKVRVTAGC